MALTGPPCSVGAALAAMTPDERALFERAIVSLQVRKSDLARTLRASGYPVSGWSLRHHSRLECKCSRTI